MTVVEMSVRRVSLPRLSAPAWDMYSDIVGNLERFAPEADLEVKATWHKASTTGPSLAAVERSLSESGRRPETITFRLRSESLDISGSLFDVTDHGGPPAIMVGAADRQRVRVARDIIIEVLETYDGVAAVPPRTVPSPRRGRASRWFGDITRNALGSAVLAGALLLLGFLPSVIRWVTGHQSKVKATPKEAVSNNSFRFRIDRSHCGLQTYVDGNGAPRRAKGSACFFVLTVVNVSNNGGYPAGPFRLSVSRQKFSTVALKGEAFTEDIFPSHSATGELVFDIPDGFSPDALEIGSPDRDDRVIVFDLTTPAAGTRLPRGRSLAPVAP